MYVFAVECRNRLVVRKKGNLKESGGSIGHKRRVSFDPLALLLDASLEGELELVMRTAEQVSVLILILFILHKCLNGKRFLMHVFYIRDIPNSFNI